MRNKRIKKGAHTFSLTSRGCRRIWLVSSLIREAKDLPVHKLRTSQFMKACRVPVWFGEEKPTVINIVNHMRRIKKAETKYPVLLSNEGIVDGFHRLAKIMLSGGKWVKFKMFDKMPEPDRIEYTDNRLAKLRHFRFGDNITAIDKAHNIFSDRTLRIKVPGGEKKSQIIIPTMDGNMTAYSGNIVMRTKDNKAAVLEDKAAFEKAVKKNFRGLKLYNL